MTGPDSSHSSTNWTKPKLFRDLWQLIALAPRNSLRNLAYAIVLGVFATLADIGSLAVLKSAMEAMALPSGQEGAAASPAIVAFLGTAMLGSALRLAAVRQTVATQYDLSSALSVIAYENLQRQDYADYLRNGASEGYAAFDRLQMLLFQALAPLIASLTAASSAVVLLFGIAVLQPWAGVLFAVVLALLAADLRSGSASDVGHGLSQMSRLKARLLYEGRAAFRDIYLTNGQDRMCEDFAAAEQRLRRKQGTAVLAAQTSRHTLELSGFGIALLAVFALSRIGIQGGEIIPLLGVIGLGCLRLLPLVATLRTALRLIAAHGEVTRDVLALLGPYHAANPSAAPVVLHQAIQLDSVTVRREGRPDPLRNISLTIPRGARIGIAGASGTGKSTLLDVLSGAIEPDAGRVSVDGISVTRETSPAWRERIGFVSQNPVLLGRTLREAVIFPQRIEAIDPARFAIAIASSGVDALARDLAEGLDTPVGEVVEHLSGGQRQRLALGHALYRARDILLLDEATGQLDSESEQSLIAAIQDLPRDLTVVLVSHRHALFACCEVVYELADGGLSIASRSAGYAADSETDADTALPAEVAAPYLTM